MKLSTKAGRLSAEAEPSGLCDEQVKLERAQGELSLIHISSGKVSLRETLGRRTPGERKVKSVTPVIQIVSKPSEAGLKRRGGRTERYELWPEAEASEAEFLPTTGP